MSNPLFSIITITFNAAGEILPTLASVDSQTCTDYEHLIIDGASTDSTLSLINGARNQRRVILSEPDRGLYDAMNKGLRRARGTYLIFLNAGDTFSSPSTLALYAEAAGPSIDIIYADTRLVDKERRVVGPRHLSAPSRLTRRSFARGMLVCHQAFAMRRELAPEYDLTYRFSADYDWCVKCIALTTPERCRNLHTVAIDYLTDGLTDRNHKASLRERFHIMCRHYGTLPTIVRHAGFALRALCRKFSHS